MNKTTSSTHLRENPLFLYFAQFVAFWVIGSAIISNSITATMQISIKVSSILAIFLLAQIHIAASCACPNLFDPVCCLSLEHRGVVTSSNICTCKCPGGVVWYKGHCIGTTDCICPPIFDPVCCKLPSGQLQTFTSSCECTCQHGSAQGSGRCY